MKRAIWSSAICTHVLVAPPNAQIAPSKGNKYVQQCCLDTKKTVTSRQSNPNSVKQIYSEIKSITLKHPPGTPMAP